MAWKKGQSGNPGGRPRSGNALSESIRRKVDPDKITDELIKIMETSASDQTKLRAIELLGERGWKKPAQVVEVGPADPYEDLSDEELEQLEAAARAELEGGAVTGFLEAEIVDASYGNPDSGAVDGDSSYGNQGGHARPGAPEADPAECRTTAHTRLHRGSVQVRHMADPEDE